MIAACVSYRDFYWLITCQAPLSPPPRSLAPVRVHRYRSCIAAMDAAKPAWAALPAPVRGEIVRKIGQALRAKKEAEGRGAQLGVTTQR